MTMASRMALAALAAMLPQALWADGFVPQAGARIDLDTLKVTYGMLGVDVTERVTGNAVVTEDGIDARDAEMPAGRHRLTVVVADTEGRVGKRRFKFRIVD